MQTSSETDTLEHIYNEHIRSRIGGIRYNPNLLSPDEFNSTLERLKKAVRTLRFISEVTDDTDEIYRTFTLERLQELVADVTNGVHLAQNLAEASGFLDALEEYFDVMVECLKTEYLPPSELELLKSLGSRDAEKELEALVTILKISNRHRSSTHPLYDAYDNPFEHGLIRHALDDTAKRLQESQVEQPQRKPKRWFKAIGQIGGGAASTIIDIAAAAGLFGVSGDPVAMVVTSTSSVTLGVGMILTGIGEWRNE